jgi:hypothetical protein
MEFLPKVDITSRDFIRQFIRVILEGLVVAICAFSIPNRNFNWRQVLIVGIAAGVSLLVLDVVGEPIITAAVRQGMGLGIGLKYTGRNIQLS